MTERQAVTAGLFGLTLLMLGMAWMQPGLWDVKLFEVILQAVVLTGLLNMVVAFHFAANKQSEKAAENTGDAFRAITATAQAGGAQTAPDVLLQPGETAQAAEEPRP